MNEITRVAVDTSKAVFTLHAVDAAGQVALRRNLRRQDVEPFFAKLPPVEVALEACAASHYWGRTLQALGHSVMLITAQYIKPYVKRSKNDRNDAEAICEAAGRPDMRRVAVKSAQRQADAMLLSVRELLVRQRTQLVNALRGHAAEFGLVAKLGDKGVTQRRVHAANDASLPRAAAEALALLGHEIDRIEARLAQIDAKLLAQHKATPMIQRLAQIPGIGPITALSLVTRIDISQFKSARHLVASLGLTPGEHSTGGKTRMGGISRAGDERLRELLVLGATVVIRHAKPGKTSAWLMALLARRPRKLSAVALANKMARVVWAMMTSGEAYRQPKLTAA